ncbi:MarR family winged helix-turn-helix transcriptional regulator [Naumannella cuiyingiana]|uniref:DNA-binding MarR family transcriptional regulator n=1 Tax=Naumannella cuiyingiana TaxID=1347891 RepID=A0A7Z0D758_9ACTN|nr:MarR family transcriptional regulator [Naumannella cuiyingiana]NYI70109.1 DNA-binding MarR family transcriptional regulator [Naumannella cuiyingiana]
MSARTAHPPQTTGAATQTDRVSARWLSTEQQHVWRTYLLGVARIAEYLDADLRRHGLDLGEYEILVCLEEAPHRRLRMSELADRVHQSRSRLTHTVARMEKSNLVERDTCPDDRRGVWAHLTPKGFELLAGAAPGHVEAVRKIFVEAVDPADFEALGRAFGAVLEVGDPDQRESAR